MPDNLGLDGSPKPVSAVRFCGPVPNPAEEFQVELLAHGPTKGDEWEQN